MHTADTCLLQDPETSPRTAPALWGKQGPGSQERRASVGVLEAPQHLCPPVFWSNSGLTIPPHTGPDQVY